MAEPLYFLPGTMCDSRLWSPLWAELNALQAKLSVDYEFIHLTIPVESTIDEIVETLAKQLPNEKINLLGFSQGGYLASAFACRFPERMKRLINLSNAPQQLPYEEIATRSKIIRWVETHGYSGITLARIRTFLHANQQTNTDITDCIKQMDHDFGANVLLQQLKSTTVRQDLLVALTSLTCPMLFCYGDSDLLVDGKFFAPLLTTNTNIRVEVFNNCGHMLPLESPLLLAKAIILFLQTS